MPRRPATFTQADIARAIRAAQQCGGAAVELDPERKVIRITPVDPHDNVGKSQPEPLDAHETVEL